MKPERCLYERLAIENQVDFLSIKGNELVFNPAYEEKLAQLMLTSNISLPDFQGLCRLCRLCSPQISQTQSGFRINRNNYRLPAPEKPKPMYSIETFSPQKKTPRTNVRITVVDDGQPKRIAKWLSTIGYPTTAFWVNSEYDATPNAQLMLINAIVQTRPGIVICDKGLGLFNGIEIIQEIRNQGPRTIMYTGEFDTRETHLVADALVTKTSNLQELLRVVNTLE